jgi:hypothetical protein
MQWISDDPYKRIALVLACVAVVVTIVALWVGRKRSILTISCALVFWILLAPVLIMLPSYFRAHGTGDINACLNNLRELQNAKEAWAKENRRLPTDIPTEIELYGANGTNGFLHHKLVCPTGGKYTINAVNEMPTCSLADKGHKLE